MKLNRLLLFIPLVCLVLTLAVAEPGYIGAGKCKMCHKVEYASWEGLNHSKAFERLNEEERSKEECLACHATNKSADLPGVQCEACHGPGSEYKSLKVMKDLEAAVSAGLILPNEATCKSCHANAPHEVPAFDYETAKGQGIHETKNPS